MKIDVFLANIACLINDDARGYIATVEYPGCIALQFTLHGQKAMAWWGTANETWGADFFATVRDFETGHMSGSITTTVPSDCPDVATIVEAIQQAMDQRCMEEEAR